MPIRVTCPDCSAVLSIPDGPAGSVVRCPGCQFRLVVAGPPARDDAAAGRPRGRVAAGGGFRVWAAVLLAVVLVGAGVYFATRGNGDGARDQSAAGKPPVGGGVVKYVPRESEEKFKALMNEKGDTPITEAEVLATMGEPGSRQPYKWGCGPKISITWERWTWKAPGSGIESSMEVITESSREGASRFFPRQGIRLAVTPVDADREAPPPRPAGPNEQPDGDD